ncbi:hypothetical protein [Rufibacter soli]
MALFLEKRAQNTWLVKAFIPLPVPGKPAFELSFFRRRGNLNFQVFGVGRHLAVYFLHGCIGNRCVKTLNTRLIHPILFT